MKVKKQVKKKKAATAILFPPWLVERYWYLFSSVNIKQCSQNLLFTGKRSWE